MPSAKCACLCHPNLTKSAKSIKIDEYKINNTLVDGGCIGCGLFRLLRDLSCFLMVIKALSVV